MTDALVPRAGLLIFPLRAGTMALATLIAAYSIAGGIVLFLYGAFLWPSKDIEVPVYGGVSMGIGACSVLLLLAFANRSRRESTSSSLFPLLLVPHLPSSLRGRH